MVVSMGGVGVCGIEAELMIGMCSDEMLCGLDVHRQVGIVSCRVRRGVLKGFRGVECGGEDSVSIWKH